MLFVWRLTNNTPDAIKNIMYAFTWKNEHDVWKEQWYTFTSWDPLQADVYMTSED
jgi:hypothetical protein